ncbi:hypothetical protein [Methanospirillum sp.]|uniref:hypothetical protein n=1 Tax=Methanospirillum sp. TaxID=45200 RepID=UPI00359F395A
MTEKNLLCPFDKKPCIMGRCAVWNEIKTKCSFALFPDLVKTSQHEPGKQARKVEEASGSGKYRTLLFD